MSGAKCAICNKTAYPLESVTALEKQYHKACFKCTTCKQSLSLKNFKGYEGKIYCFTHTPKPNATTVTDSVAMKTALAAPKKTSEGLGTVQKGIGGKPTIQVFGVEGAAGGASSEVETSTQSYSEPSHSHQSYDEPAVEAEAEAEPEQYDNTYSEEPPQDTYQDEYTGEDEN